MKSNFFPILAAAFLIAGIWGADSALARPNGNLDLKVAVVCYNPYMTNVAELTTSRRLNAVFGWPTGQSMANDQASWWKQATDNMVKVNFVVVTNLNIFPLFDNGGRFNQQSYYDYMKKGGAHPGGNFDYSHFLTNDIPWSIPAIEAGKIDQIWLYGWPGMNTYETRLFGKGAIGCNSSGFGNLDNERMFMICMPSIERPDTPMENFGHGCEWVLGSWFWNYVYSYTGGINYTNTSDLALYRAHGSESASNISIGDVHYAPNSTTDYDWGNKTYVNSYADCWYDYPFMTNWVSRSMNCSEWGGGVNYKHKIWFFNHMPRRLGLRRGHLMNWMTKYLKINNAAYPIGDGEIVEQTDVDLAGFFAFETYVPESATSVTFRVKAGRPVMHGIRKNYIPFFRRYAQGSGKAYDSVEYDKETEFSYTLTPDSCYGKGLSGTWYISFGNAYGVAPTQRPLDGNTNYVVSVEILPKPKALGENGEYLEVTSPMQGECWKNISHKVKWEYKAPEDGWRCFKIAYSVNDMEGPFKPVCEDFYYELDKQWTWLDFPRKETSPQARIRIIAEDRHGNAITNYSGLFGIGVDPVPEPATGLVIGLLCTLALFRRP